MRLLLFILFSTIFLSYEHGHHKHAHNRPARKISTIQRIENAIIKGIEKIPGFEKIFMGFQSIVDHFNKLSVLLKILLAITFISLLPIGFLLTIPVSANSDSILLSLMISFAAGCLLGDSFLHLIPHVYSEHEGKESEIGAYILAGIFIFYFIEKILNTLKTKCCHPSQTIRQKLIEDVLDFVPHKTKGRGSVPDEHGKTLTCSATAHGNISETGGILNLIADTVHNFMDGAAIASTFMINPRMGVATTFSIFMHEIPHEISDFAILVKSGFSPIKAIALQLLTACGAFSGALVTYYLGHSLGDSGSLIVPSLAAGGFIYISCVSIIPDMLSKKVSVYHCVGESLSILVGVFVFTLMD